MAQQKVYYVCEVRDTSLLSSATSYSDLQSKFAASQPSKATLLNLSQLVSQAGGSIKYLSKDWRRVGIMGNLASLAGAHVYRIDALLQALSASQSEGRIRPEDVTGGLKDIANAIAILIGVIIAGPALVEMGVSVLVAEVIVGIGGVAAGVIGGFGFAELFSDSPNNNNYFNLPPGGAPDQVGSPPFDPLDAGSYTIAVLPEAPPDGGAGILNLGTITISDQPDSPTGRV